MTTQASNDPTHVLYRIRQLLILGYSFHASTSGFDSDKLLLLNSRSTPKKRVSLA